MKSRIWKGYGMILQRVVRRKYPYNVESFGEGAKGQGLTNDGSDANDIVFPAVFLLAKDNIKSEKFYGFPLKVTHLF